jgi:hypothetical protein
LPVTFGLGNSAKADDVQVIWPSGKVDHLAEVGGDQFVTVTEGQGVTARQALRRRT